jgi:hypothetical protein
VGVAVGAEILIRTTASGRLAMCWLAVKPISPVTPCHESLMNWSGISARPIAECELW